MPVRYGYARVSTREQHTDTQKARLEQCCHRVFVEVASGMKRDRPHLEKLLDHLMEGDARVVTKLDRLARSTFHLYQIAERLKHVGATLEVLDQHMDSATPAGEALFGFLAIMAQFEHALRRERQREGIVAAQAKGVHCGRSRMLTPDQVAALHDLHASGVGVSELTRRFCMTRTSIYRYLAETAPDQAEAADYGILGAAVPPPPGR